MARAVHKLTALKVRTINEPGRYNDGDGLYLYVSNALNRSWVFRYRDRRTGKLRDKGLGAERHLTLEKARKAASEARELIRGGFDPIDAPRIERAQKRSERLQMVTFKHCTDRYITTHGGAWRNAKHAAQWRSTLDTYAANLLPLSVAAVDTPHVLACLEPIWDVKTETATRVRQRIEAVLDWATARKYRTGDNPARWRGHLDKLLAKPQKLKRVTPRAALPWDAMPAFYADLRQREGLAARALELQILTATRPGEAAGAHWTEIDLADATWTIAADRMKAGREHRVPLSRPALELLKALPRTEGEALVFPGQPNRHRRGTSAPLTTAAPLKVLKELRPGITAHGFRSTFRDWAADATSCPREVAEQALAHALRDQTEAAYRRSDLFAKRAKLMADWAKHCTTQRDATVASIAKARQSRRAK